METVNCSQRAAGDSSSSWRAVLNLYNWEGIGNYGIRHLAYDIASVVAGSGRSWNGGKEYTVEVLANKSLAEAGKVQGDSE